jgi:hypothetical protein
MAGVRSGVRKAARTARPARGLRGLARELPHDPADLRRMAGIDKATRRLLLVGVMPL